MKTLFVSLSLSTALLFRVVGAPVTNAVPGSAASFYRSYQIDTNCFYSNLSRKFRLNSQRPAILIPALTNYWHEKRIDVSSLYYRPAKGILVFYATEEQHKRLAFLLTEFQPSQRILLGSNHRAALDAGRAVHFVTEVTSPARVSELPRSSTSAKLTPVMRASLTAFLRRGLSPHQFTPMSGAHNFLQATPVFGFLFVLSQVPGAPDDNHWAKTEKNG